MLTQGLQLGVLRDIYCGQNVAELKKWNCLEKSYTFYCCSYIEDEEVCYCVCEDEADTYQFLYDAWLKGHYPTLFVADTQRLQVASGTEDTLKRELQLQAAQKSRGMLPKTLLLGLHEAEQLISSGKADKTLQEWQDELQGVFRLELLQLFQGAMELAAIHKTLSESLYRELRDWLNRMYEQIEDRPKKNGEYKRSMSGFAYSKEGYQWKYFFDAQPLIALRKQQEFQCQGLFTTPVWQKNYWCKSRSDLPNVRKDFSRKLEQYMDEKYLQTIAELWQLPSGLDINWQAQYFSHTEVWSEAAQKTRNFYKHLWHLES